MKINAWSSKSQTICCVVVLIVLGVSVIFINRRQTEILGVKEDKGVKIINQDEKSAVKLFGGLGVASIYHNPIIPSLAVEDKGSIPWTINEAVVNDTPKNFSYNISFKSEDVIVLIKVLAPSQSYLNTRKCYEAKDLDRIDANWVRIPGTPDDKFQNGISYVKASNLYQLGSKEFDNLYGEYKNYTDKAKTGIIDKQLLDSCGASVGFNISKFYINNTSYDGLVRIYTNQLFSELSSKQVQVLEGLIKGIKI
jgi:hypothetical protein